MDHFVMNESSEDLIRDFLRSNNSVESENLLFRIIHDHVQPIIKVIIKTKLRVSLGREGSSQNQDALDIAGDVSAAVLEELQSVKAGGPSRPISNFQNYVAIKTYSACADYFRSKNPQRRRLKDFLRHHLKHNRKFAVWEGADKRWLCGFQTWRSAELHTGHSERLQQLLSEPLSVFVATESTSAGVGSRLAPAELLTIIFERVRHPIEFDDLVTIAAVVWGIKDQPAESFDHDDKAVAGLIDSATRADVVVEQRLYLQRLWTEVAALPPLQRGALLLNLRDAQGGSVIAFIPHLGIALKHEIAHMLSMPAEQFSTLWNELPLEDARIAQLFGITRQQVINLRKTARERLARRMKTTEKKQR